LLKTRIVGGSGSLRHSIHLTVILTRVTEDSVRKRESENCDEGTTARSQSPGSRLLLLTFRSG
jgi:hypothetical protein